MEFAKALTNIQEINLGSPALAAGLSGKSRNRLLNRIRRISGKPKVHSGFAEGFIAASILMISLAGLSAAAMINNPADYSLPDPPPVFHELGGVLPDIHDYQAVHILPDTTEEQRKAIQQKKQQEHHKQQELQQQRQHQQQLQDQKAIQEAMLEQQKEIKAAMALEIQTLKEQMKAVDEQIKAYVESEDYQDAYKQAMQNREKYEQQMIKAMEAYEKAMEESRLNYHSSGSWSLPQVYFKDGKTYVYDSDTNVWHHYAPNFYLHGDSLHDIYFDSWSDKYEEAWEAYEDRLILSEGKLINAYAQMEDLEELMEAAELEVFEVPEFDFDYDYDYDYNYDHFDDARHHFFMPGSIDRIVRDELYEDELIDRGREYIILIGKKQMLINGEKQSRSVFKKYRRLVDSVDKPWSTNENEEVSIHIGR